MGKGIDKSWVTGTEEKEMSSETDTSRLIFCKYVAGLGLGLDIGFGGSAFLPSDLDCITFDLDRPYTKVGEDKQIMRGNCRDLSMFCDESLWYIHSSHLLEDFSYNQQINIITEWRRVLALNGVLLLNCPDQQRFLAHCGRTGQGINLAHYEQDFSLNNFKDRVLKFTGDWQEIFVEPNHGPYSWLLIVRKI